MEKLLNSKEIAEMYGVSAHVITQNWCRKGLKFIRGTGGFLIRPSWVESFLEEQSEKEASKRVMVEMPRLKPKYTTGRVPVMSKFDYENMKIV